MFEASQQEDCPFFLSRAMIIEKKGLEPDPATAEPAPTAKAENDDEGETHNDDEAGDSEEQEEGEEEEEEEGKDEPPANKPRVNKRPSAKD